MFMFIWRYSNKLIFFLRRSCNEKVEEGMTNYVYIIICRNEACHSLYDTLQALVIDST